ncbi:MAG TPA: hypothetical protein VHA09_00835 [Nitrososphaera sp.]|nr:hypothetical protein [Nitrososphaera sp.]
MPCSVHTDFFDDSCPDCRQEYLEMKGIGADISNEGEGEEQKGRRATEEVKEEEKKYKEFTEARAKKLFEEILLQYLKSGSTDTEAAEKAKAIVRKQCAIRKMPYWPWL